MLSIQMVVTHPNAKSSSFQKKFNFQMLCFTPNVLEQYSRDQNTELVWNSNSQICPYFKCLLTKQLQFCPTVGKMDKKSGFLMIPHLNGGGIFRKPNFQYLDCDLKILMPLITLGTQIADL